MTKQQFQKELLEKIKPGTKPSDFKKPRRIIRPKSPKDEGYSSGEESINNETIAGQTESISTTSTKQIKDLQKQVNFYSNTANSHLKNLQLAQVRITNLEEQVKGLKAQKTPPKESELLTEKNKQIEIIAKENEKNLAKVKELQAKLAEQEQTITQLKNQAKSQANNQDPVETKTFLCSECNQTKPQSELSRVFGKFSFCLECSKQARQIARRIHLPPLCQR